LHHVHKGTMVTRMTTPTDDAINANPWPDDYDPLSAENLEALDPPVTFLGDTEKELSNPTPTMVFLRAVLLSEDSPFYITGEGIDREQLDNLAKAAAYVCTFTTANDIATAGRKIAGDSIRSGNPTKANLGKSVSEVLTSIAESMLPKEKS